MINAHGTGGLVTCPSEAVRIDANYHEAGLLSPVCAEMISQTVWSDWDDRQHLT